MSDSRCFSSRTIAGSLAIAAIVAASLMRSRPTSSAPATDGVPSGGDPYKILGVSSDADKQAVTKAYRALARRWHPDKHSGDEAAGQIFATVAHAYDVLTDPEKREIFDRLGEQGLERLRDGDPSVQKDWLPADEILRRLHNDGDEPFLQSLVTSAFASLSSLWSAWEALMPYLRSAAIFIGLDSAAPSVIITASDASGAAIASGGVAREAVTFKLALSGKSFDFTESDVSHNCPRHRFLGMKTTFYLQCEHAPGVELAVSVPAGAFSVTAREGVNTASETFRLSML